ncbi:hypothetical protein [Amycolatopsis sp. CA-230715]|uniref:hypothetical protein n=1 Tax=Amycolatopsis sp. CA-230715 TaxID=2745196 RepID=UPI001C031BA0|nr:hypothetical protein [Amycolatopsis sp. CA-230715]QWF85746.1 hypothetical protein HUW46_09226 [Amycolatopsis sp. CA-230715]
MSDYLEKTSAPASADRVGASSYRQHPHELCGSDAARQSVGDPGHCETCCSVGHVVAHPDLGCGDVGCYRTHGDEHASAAGSRCCTGPFADGRHALGCAQRCQDCQGDPDGPAACPCRDTPGVTTDNDVTDGLVDKNDKAHLGERNTYPRGDDMAATEVARVVTAAIAPILNRIDRERDHARATIEALMIELSHTHDRLGHVIALGRWLVAEKENLASNVVIKLGQQLNSLREENARLTSELHVSRRGASIQTHGS